MAVQLVRDGSSCMLHRSSPDTHVQKLIPCDAVSLTDRDDHALDPFPVKLGRGFGCDLLEAAVDPSGEHALRIRIQPPAVVVSAILDANHTHRTASLFDHRIDP
ncbi:hypothetical protein ADL19_14830 [Streptomyces purpurogeneiscleroticus]|nr:hypothetical protein ADL19_14830 [Streptomyces purpurogeneiscleroticus]